MSNQDEQGAAREIHEGEKIEQGQEIQRKIIVDADNPGNEIQPTMKSGVLEKKINVIKFIAFTHKAILFRFLGETADQKDLTLGDQIHDVLFTAYTILKQQHNLTADNLAQGIAATDYKITYNENEYNVPREHIHKIVMAKAQEYQIPFGNFELNTPENWYGIANLFFNFLGGFALRQYELRVGHSTMIIQEANGEQKAIKVDQYGIDGVHHTLCEGISFSPEKRASIPPLVGPITALLSYLQRDKFSEEWEDVDRKNFTHFPEMDSVLSVMEKSTADEMKILMSLIADCALMTTRRATKMSPPPAAFSYIITTPQHRVGNILYSSTNITNNFKFSGKWAFVFYAVFSSIQWKIRLNEATDTQAKQIVYYSMMGTYIGDLEIMAKITNQVLWNTKEELGDILKASIKTCNLIEFLPIQQIYCLEFAKDNMIQLCNPFCGQVSTMPVFSGRTIRVYSAAFFECMKNDPYKPITRKSMQELIATYSKLKMKLATSKAQNKTNELEKAGWCEMAHLISTLNGVEDKN